MGRGGMEADLGKASDRACLLEGRGGTGGRVYRLRCVPGEGSGSGSQRKHASHTPSSALARARGANRTRTNTGCSCSSATAPSSPRSTVYPPLPSVKPLQATNENTFVHSRCFLQLSLQRLVDGRPLVSRSCICINCTSTSWLPKGYGRRVHLDGRFPCCRCSLAGAISQDAAQQYLKRDHGGLSASSPHSASGQHGSTCYFPSRHQDLVLHGPSCKPRAEDVRI
ncbi:hypothetical protein B0T16DRAFT_34544 [Cercophora newfieldiana]|uniref:Uncharacterized protein n=1 Tax=Cercophora newfieldiana TaxID=92897 RepID=A0AA40CYJ5_9PEZI|nr:hypothetical protein B0T16DRAFT_34544 [Cercophora newfieldiana]